MVSAGGVRGSEEARPGPEDVWARRAALVVALLGIIVVIVPAALHIRQVLSHDPFAAPIRTVIIVREVDGKQEKETTTSPGNQSALDRSLSSGGLVLLRLGVVALASFLAGATVQRIMAGDFSGKFGPVELRKLSRAAAASSTAVRDLTQGLQVQKAATRHAAVLATRTARKLKELEARVDDMPKS